MHSLQTLGFEQLESPDFGFGVIWLKLGSELCLHLIERDPKFNLPEGPYSATSAVKDPNHLFRGHHICLSLPISTPSCRVLRTVLLCFYVCSYILHKLRCLLVNVMSSIVLVYNCTSWK